MCCTNIKCHMRSMKASNCSPWCWIGMLEETQTSRAFGQSHSACPLVSASTPQILQVGSLMIFLLQRFVFVDKTFLHAFHAKDRILFGICKRQSVLQNTLVFSLFEGPLWEVDVLLEMKSANALLMEKMPLGVQAQTMQSGGSVWLIGILRMAWASWGVKISFKKLILHCRVS